MKMKLTTDFKDDLLERLSDPEYAAGYLSACAAEGREELLLGLRNVAEAFGGMRQLSNETELNRENLYDMLSENGNPKLSSILSILDAIGIDMQFHCKQVS